MRDADMPRFAGMGENVMAALYTAQCPSIRFELLDNLGRGLPLTQENVRFTQLGNDLLGEIPFL